MVARLSSLLQRRLSRPLWSGVAATRFGTAAAVSTAPTPAEQPSETQPKPAQAAFSSLGISNSLCTRLHLTGIEGATQIQAQVIPRLLRRLNADTSDGWDFCRESLVINAMTGSGKTLAYLLPILQSLAPDNKGVQCVIIVPSAELAKQITCVCTSLGASALHWSRIDDVATIKADTPSVLVGTVKALSSAWSSETFRLKLSRVRWVVVDEADTVLRPPSRYEPLSQSRARSRKRAQVHMLIEDLLRIPHKFRVSEDINDPIEYRQNSDAMSQTQPLLLCISATVNNRLKHVIKSRRWADQLLLLRPPSTQSFGELPSCLHHRCAILPSLGVSDANLQRTEADLARHFATLYEADKRPPALFIAHQDSSLSRLREALKELGFRADFLHDSAAANSSLVAGTLDVVLASGGGLAGSGGVRGLDLPALKHVYLGFVCDSAGAYLHLSGRTARLGRRGTATSLVEKENVKSLAKLVDSLGAELEIHEI